MASGSRADAQLRSWANAANGLWTTASAWNPADVPDTVAESADFARFGEYKVTLPGGQPPLEVGGLHVTFGEVTFRPDGVGDATLRVAGDALIDDHSSLRFVEIGGTQLDFQVDGQMRIDPGSGWFIEAGNVTTGSLSIASTLGGNYWTGVVLQNGSTADFGDVNVAEGHSPSHSLLSLYTGSSATVDNLMIGAMDDDLIAEVNIEASSLVQNEGGVTTIGVAQSFVATDRSVLTVTEGGSATLNSVEILNTGRLLNAGGVVTLKGELSIVDGLYQESDDAQRDFTGLDLLSVSGMGNAVLVGAPLVLAEGQTLSLDQGTLRSAGGLVVEGGQVQFGASGQGDVTGAVTLKPGGSITVAPDGRAVFQDTFTDEGGAFTVPAGGWALFGGDYSGPGIAGAGLVEFVAALQPGMSVGDATFGGDLYTEKLVIEVAGVGAHDRVTVAGEATLNQRLVVELVEPDAGQGVYAPALGDAFPVLSAGSIVGGFTELVAPELEPGMEWRLVQTGTSLTLRVVAPSTPGDFNYDGVVDAADYTVWRDTAGSSGPLMAADANGDDLVDEAEYLAWRGAYGATEPAVVVPEPAAPALLAAALWAAMVAGLRGRP